jgi:hypothetical protein
MKLLWSQKQLEALSTASFIFAAAIAFGLVLWRAPAVVTGTNAMSYEPTSGASTAHLTQARNPLIAILARSPVRISPMSARKRMW